MLGRNVAGRRVVVHPYGLGTQAGEVEFRIPGGADANLGGYSRCAGTAAGERVPAEVRPTARVLAENGLDRVDLVKIDTEGAEHDILTSLPLPLLQAVKWIYGELHSADGDALTPFRVLDCLAQWLDIAVHKSLRKRRFFFDACNRAISARFSRLRRST